MKWETIKKNCARELYNNIKNCYSNIELIQIYSLQQMIKNGKLNKYKEAQHNVADICWNIVTNWDIRCINELIQVFPNKIPTFVKNNNFYIEYTDNGWELNKKNYEQNNN